MTIAVTTPLINFKLLAELEQDFQKNLGELIELYIIDADRKLNLLEQAKNDNNLSNLLCAARELRARSMELGAVKFAFTILGLELAIQERRFESLDKTITKIKKDFTLVNNELNKIKNQLNNHHI